jgi:type I restriction enzyme S subunit
MAVWSIVAKRQVKGWRRLDAEFWRPEYCEAYERVVTWSHAHALGAIAKRMAKGIFYILADEYVQDGVPFLRVSNVKSVLLDTNNVVHISDERNQQDKKTCFATGDVVINKTGDIGAAVIDLPACNISQDLIGVEIADKHAFNPYYLATFLNTKYGRLQLRRWFQGQVQMHLALTDARKIAVPFPSQDQQQRVEEIILAARQEATRSQFLYAQAEDALLGELGWNKVEVSQPKSWLVTVSRTRDIRRMDAEHFQPRYERLVNHLRKTGLARPMAEVAPYVKRGLQPVYMTGGEVIVVNSQHLGRHLLNVEATERTDRQFWDENSRSRLRKGDVLLYSTGAYVGRTNVWLEDQDGVASNHVTMIRPNDSCDARYLAVFLNAPPGLLQAEKWASGSGQRELYPEDIARFLVYLPPNEFQQKVAELVDQSYRARQKSKVLLERAKRTVEALIEGTAAPQF